MSLESVSDLAVPHPWQNMRIENLTVDGAFVNNGTMDEIVLAEEVAPTNSAGFTTIYMDSTTHLLTVKQNNNTATLPALVDSSNRFSAVQQFIGATNLMSLQTNGTGFSYLITSNNPAANRAISFQDPLQDAVVATNPMGLITLTGTVILNKTTHCNSLLGIDSSAGAVAITLPTTATAGGCKYRIFWQVAGNNSTVVPSSGNIFKGIILNAATSVLTKTGVGTITFVTGTAGISDYVDLVCDGVNWQMLAATTVNGGITAA